jgi:hypothetical protein
MGNTLRVGLFETLEFFLETFNFGGSIRNLLLCAGDLQFDILQGYQVPKIGIHLVAPSRVSKPEEDRARVIRWRTPQPAQFRFTAIIEAIRTQKSEM